MTTDPVSPTADYESIERQAAAAGIDSRENIRQGLIAWRDNALSMENPPWDGIVLLSHAIWWLAQNASLES